MSNSDTFETPRLQGLQNAYYLGTHPKDTLALVREDRSFDLQNFAVRFRADLT